MPEVAKPIPVGPELDRAVAAVLGTMPEPIDVVRTMVPGGVNTPISGGSGYAMPLPRSYSTDHATQLELLVWLQRAPRDVYPQLQWQGQTAGGWQCYGSVHGMPDELIVWGSTVSEALCRLVLAVAEAKR